MVNVSNKDKSITKPTPFEIFFYVNCSCPSPEGMNSLTIWVAEYNASSAMKSLKIWIAEYIALRCDEESEDLGCRIHSTPVQ